MTPADPAVQQALDRRALLLVLGSLLVCLFLSAVDQTIVSTALPTIVGDLGGIDHLAWIVTAYLLTSTVSVPLAGKISDLFGRRPVLQATIAVFLLGSVLAGASQTMTQLIVARGIQGIGGGGILSISFTILGDVLSPRERGRYAGYFTGVFASASVVGPLAGGFIVDHLSWRWVFYVNLPLGVASMVVAGRYLRIPRPARQRSIDFVGAALMTCSVTAILLVGSWGGREHAWGSPTIVALILTGVVAAIAFVAQERRAAEPILPLRLFGDPVIAVCVAIGALLGPILVAGSTFLPLFLQVVTGASASSSGFLLLPMMGGLLIGSNVTGRLVSASGRYKRFPVAGTALAIGGAVLLAGVDVSTSRLMVSTAMGILGLGIGCTFPIMTLAVQNSASFEDMGAATSAVNFFRSLGSVIGIAALGTLMNQHLDDARSVLGDGAAGGEGPILGDPQQIRSLPPDELRAISEGIADGVGAVFLVSLPFVVAAFALALVLREVPLRETVHVRPETEGFGEPEPVV